MSNKSRQLKIGILSGDFSWTTILDQIGVDWDTINSMQTISFSSYSVVIVDRPVTKVEETIINEYIASGGAILYTTSESKQVMNKSIHHRYHRSLSPHRFEAYNFSEIFDLYHKAYTFQNGSLLLSEPVGAGLVSYLGIDVSAAMSHAGSKRKSFYAERKQLPHEIVSKQTRSVLREIILSHLEFLHHQRGLPFIHKWFFPKDHQTIFTFRIDSDKGTQSEIEKLYQLGKQYHIPTTWFLDTKSHESWLDYFRTFESQEIGVHCYEHSVYRSTVLNKENFEKASTLLKHHGLQPKGIAVPTGAWNSWISHAIQEIGFAYSSEFSYDYDNLPSFPFWENTTSSVVQLPIHPMCVGTMRRDHMTSKEMMDYFRTVIDLKIHRREPICLYHHPSHGATEVFQEVFQYINDQSILKLSYADYAEWWNKRNTTSFIAISNEEGLDIQSEDAPDNQFFRISLPNGTESITSLRGILPLKELRWNRSPLAKEPSRDLLRTRKTTIRHYIQNALDWWIKTTE